MNRPWPLGFKNGMRNWVNFFKALKSLKNCTLMGSFCPKHIMFQLENFRGIVCHDTEKCCKIKGKLTCGLKNDIRNLVNIHASSQKSENLHFDWIHFTKAYKDLDEKLQKSYVSWHWRVMQSLKKSWLLAPKITWGIWWTLMQAVASLKICTLMCYFC